MSRRPDGPRPIAYLCSAYPAISHTFVLREVLALRRLGLDVRTFSVRRQPASGLLAPVDRAEAATTESLLPAGPATVVRAWTRLLTRRRGLAALRSAARLAWALRPVGAKGALWQAFYLNEAVLLWAACARRDVRHVHAHFANVASDVALLTAALGTALDPDDPWSWSFTMHGPAEFWNVAANRLAEKAARADFVACISDFCRSQLMALTDPDAWDHLHVVGCGIEPDAYAAPTADRAAATGGPVRLLSIGRLAPVKAQALLVDLVAELGRRGCDVVLDLVGEGPERGRLEARIAALDLGARVQLLGALGQDQIPERLRAADVFVLPSFAEGVPVVLMEAMASGVPVVASRIAGIPELVRDGETGRLATPARLDELADAVEELVRDPALRARLGAAGRVAVRERHDVDREAKVLAPLFRRPDLRDTVARDADD